jgi:hypothetical protein
LLAEYGIVMPKGLHQVRKRVGRILADPESGLSELCRDILQDVAQRGLVSCCAQVVCPHGSASRVHTPRRGHNQREEKVKPKKKTKLSASCRACHVNNGMRLANSLSMGLGRYQLRS